MAQQRTHHSYTLIEQRRECTHQQFSGVTLGTFDQMENVLKLAEWFVVLHWYECVDWNRFVRMANTHAHRHREWEGKWTCIWNVRMYGSTCYFQFMFKLVSVFCSVFVLSHSLGVAVLCCRLRLFYFSRFIFYAVSGVAHLPIYLISFKLKEETPLHIWFPHMKYQSKWQRCGNGKKNTNHPSNQPTTSAEPRLFSFSSFVYFHSDLILTRNFSYL